MEFWMQWAGEFCFQWESSLQGTLGHSSLQIHCGSIFMLAANYLLMLLELLAGPLVFSLGVNPRVYSIPLIAISESFSSPLPLCRYFHSLLHSGFFQKLGQFNENLKQLPGFKSGSFASKNSSKILILHKFWKRSKFVLKFQLNWKHKWLELALIYFLTISTILQLKLEVLTNFKYVSIVVCFLSL